MSMETSVAALEENLKSFDADARRAASGVLAEKLASGEISSKQLTNEVNLHCHTCFSYNGYGMSPSAVAWWMRKEGAFAAGLVDFDVLDGVEEFLSACTLLGLRGMAGMETRVSITELIDKVINSPGEPGIAYHMGFGFAGGSVPAAHTPFLRRLREGAAQRTKSIVEKVNSYLAPASLDYEADVLPLTPAGNATERHVCAAYDAKARRIFGSPSELARFWAGKLGVKEQDAAKLCADPVKLQGEIRSKTMKAGGPGYILPQPESFPPLKEMNEFIAACGAIPVLTWLNGESAGENAIDQLFAVHEKYGAVAANIIPDRNHNFKDPEVQKKKVHELQRFIKACKDRDFPMFVGTEMNAPGLKMIDDFACDALRPFVNDFADAGAIGYAHTLLLPHGKGFMSGWSTSTFQSRRARNAFYATLGRKLDPLKARETVKRAVGADHPDAIIAHVVKAR